MKASHLFLLLVIGASSSGCSSVISPYLHLPREPLQQDQAEVMASVSALPYTLPNWYYAAGGSEALARYALTDAFTLQGRAWAKFGSLQHGYIDGLSLEGITMVHGPRHPWRVAIIPRVMVMTSGLQIRGWGTSLSAAVWGPEILGMHPYVGAGGIFGAESDQSWYSSMNALGYGAIGNLGVSTTLLPKLDLHAEIAMTLIGNTYDHRWYAGAVPTFTASYQF
jgi:hypothetical protein